MDAAVAALRTLPVSGDGVIVTPGMSLFHIDPYDESIAENRVSSRWEKYTPTSNGSYPDYVSERHCYADRANAEKARGG